MSKFGVNTVWSLSEKAPRQVPASSDASVWQATQPPSLSRLKCASWENTVGEARSESGRQDNHCTCRLPSRR